MITIVDYQMGNLRSVQKALEHVGHAARISGRADEIASAQKLILPGVGAYGDAMREIRERDLADPIRRFIDSGLPFLGICLGMQLLFESSDESPCVPGLGILRGKAERFHVEPPLKVPHMGWNQVQRIGVHPFFDRLPANTNFYFVHSYYVVPEDRSLTALTSAYPEPFCAAIQVGNVLATQFHPEKSQTAGLRLLARFAAL
jgi:glutamine amidotransferase